MYCVNYQTIELSEVLVVRSLSVNRTVQGTVCEVTSRTVHGSDSKVTTISDYRTVQGADCK